MSIRTFFTNLSWKAWLAIACGLMWTIAWGPAIGYLIWVSFEEIPESAWLWFPAAVTATPYVILILVLLVRRWRRPVPQGERGPWEKSLIRFLAGIALFIVENPPIGWILDLLDPLYQKIRNLNGAALTWLHHQLIYPLRWHFFWEVITWPFGVRWTVTWREPDPNRYETFEPYWEVGDWSWNLRILIRRWVGLGVIAAIIVLGWLAVPVLFLVWVLHAFLAETEPFPLTQEMLQPDAFPCQSFVLPLARFYATVSGDKRLWWQSVYFPWNSLTGRFGWLEHEKLGEKKWDRIRDMSCILFLNRGGVTRSGLSNIMAKFEKQPETFGEDAVGLSDGLVWPVWPQGHWITLLPRLIWWFFARLCLGCGLRLILNLYFVYVQEVTVIRVQDSAVGIEATATVGYAAVKAKGATWTGIVVDDRGRERTKTIVGPDAFLRLLNLGRKNANIMDANDTDTWRAIHREDIGKEAKIGAAWKRYAQDRAESGEIDGSSYDED